MPPFNKYEWTANSRLIVISYPDPPIKGEVGHGEYHSSSTEFRDTISQLVFP